MVERKKVVIEIPEQEIILDLSDRIVEIRVHNVPEKTFKNISRKIKPTISEGYPSCQWVTFLAKVTMWLE